MYNKRVPATGSRNKGKEMKVETKKKLSEVKIGEEFFFGFDRDRDTGAFFRFKYRKISNKTILCLVTPSAYRQSVGYEYPAQMDDDPEVVIAQ